RAHAGRRVALDQTITIAPEQNVGHELLAPFEGRLEIVWPIVKRPVQRMVNSLSFVLTYAPVDEEGKTRDAFRDQAHARTDGAGRQRAFGRYCDTRGRFLDAPHVLQPLLGAFYARSFLALKPEDFGAREE
ncbi:MAG TPA: hypothetical protein VHJ19_10055, partial [Gammaproteobacteria bacterium]|nr:hypothetical protein [Gammaproteobacteria bacterium]